MRFICVLLLLCASSVHADELKKLKRSDQKLRAQIRDLRSAIFTVQYQLGNFISVKGDRGEKGEKGDVGAKGDSGANGEKGDQGIQGEMGLQGEQGLKGDPGIGILDVVPSGTKLSGILGVRGSVEGTATIGAIEAISAKIEREIGDQNIFVVRTYQFKQACDRDYPGNNNLCLSDEMLAKDQSGEAELRCNPENPTPGTLCIYPTQVYNVDRLHVRQTPAVGLTEGIDAFFGTNAIFKNPETGKHHAFVASWTYVVE